MLVSVSWLYTLPLSYSRSSAGACKKVVWIVLHFFAVGSTFPCAFSVFRLYSLAALRTVLIGCFLTCLCNYIVWNWEVVPSTSYGCILSLPNCRV